jgi:hypothetical protein
MRHRRRLPLDAGVYCRTTLDSTSATRFSSSPVDEHALYSPAKFTGLADA